MEVPRLSYALLPQEPGVYTFLDKKGNVLYVGKAINLKKRVSSYFQKTAGLGPKTKALVEKIHRIKTVHVSSEVESLLLEANYIKKYSPQYNIRLTDGKSYPLIRITIRHAYPAVLVVRKPEDTQSLYFGPFPNSKALRTVLKIIRRIFPYQSVENHPKNLCLYNHLRLCPCPNVSPTQQSKQEYKKTMRRIVTFLEGNVAAVIKDLEKEMEQYSESEAFEQAAHIQHKIQAIHLIVSPVHKPTEYELNPNLKSDLRFKELSQLQEILNNNGYTLDYLHRIECFDMSNIQGFNAVGSMVVVTDGGKDSSQYRRFKIRFQPDGKPNDFAAMEEVLQRRLKHQEWETPDLIIVDGGKGQVSSALKALAKMQKQIPVIGLAKREETIITSDFKEISLPKNNEALLLLRRIRDEAHRFAITYHRKLRSKTALYK